MREIKTEIEIAAPPAKVWAVLSDFDHWSDWNPIIIQAAGKAVSGAKLNITMIGKDNKDGPKYSPEIMEIEEATFFRWRAKMMAGFIFTNDKLIKLEATSNGTRVIHSELFSGLMIVMCWKQLNEHVPSMLEKMNEALKKESEI